MGGSVLVSAIVTFWKTRTNEDSIRDIWAWKNMHEKDSSATRFACTERFGLIEGSIREKNARDEEILRRLSRLENMLEQLLNNHKERI